MTTPDIAEIDATVIALNDDKTIRYQNISTGTFDYANQRFSIDVTLYGKNKQDQLNNIMIYARDAVGLSINEGLFVNRDLLAPSLDKVTIQKDQN
jgi:hypothetical protein